MTMQCKICNGNFRYIKAHLKKAHHMEPMEYYIKYLSDTHEQPVCQYCGKAITEFRGNTISKGPDMYCSKECRYKAHSKDMKNLHEQGTYVGTSKLGEYNKSEKHRKIASENAKNRRLDKESTAFNSEYSDRIRNRDNILSRYNLTDERYLYVLVFDDKIKVGSTSKLDRRLGTLSGFNAKHIYKGTVEQMANLECELFLAFKNHTLLSEDGTYYTEYLDRDCLDAVLTFINSNI